MNRFEFFSQLRKSLIDTTKEVTIPLLADELEKVENAADQLIGIKWTSLEGLTPTSFSGTQERYMNKKSIVIYSDGETLKAFEKICTSCQTLAHYLAFDQTLKCFSCEEAFHLPSETGDLTCKHYYTKEINGEWFIGM